MNILEAEQISKRYAKHEALREVSLQIPRQAIFGLLGPNGAGKTTLIRIINQIINADSGTIYIKGEKLKPKHIADIGYLPEERGLYPKMKVGEHLLYLAQLKGLNARDAINRINDWFDRLNISGWSEKKIEDLSKGMQQKIQFIATVVHEPDLIILDEPFTGFDPVNANLIKDEILKLRESGKTIIFSTHRMESVEEMCSHVALIHKAEKILDGTKAEIKNRYRTNTFLVAHSGVLNGLNMEYTLLEEKALENGDLYSTLQIDASYAPNDLLRELINCVEVHSFQEKIPSMNEIFIREVQEN
ncbi:ABC-2 type transport system ATP-binding protein [Catalinimonas alkaloidigena]|uniref:ABC transporter ATP-binding protein n=1 Tax=Catalinimonas alkaloidigena TaxID=1075417 RepID=UPI002406B9A2|nr:ATP-binding cassette domain-containing protein [Catalinimonas alkaloidigena]MDF9798490.1 ABC-2 type transport system ATP-binding protein [Catalinimonas alkaloidigena]